MTAPPTTLKRTRSPAPRQQRRHWWEDVDWPMFAVWIGGAVLAVAFWTAMGLEIVALV